MTMKFTKVSVGIALALFGCSSGSQHGSPGTAGNNTGAAGQSSGGSTGTAGQASGAAGQSSGGSTGTAGGGAGVTGTAGGGAGVTGTAGVTGMAGSTGVGGSMAGATGTGGVPVADDNVLERGKRPSRDGNYIQPTLTTAAAMKMAPDTAFNAAATYTGSMFASPLYLANGPGGKGIYILATTNNDVKAVDDTGAMVWLHSIGANPGAMNITPKGIVGTPVIDTKAGADGAPTVYVCGPASSAASGGKIDHYELHALSTKDGTERTGWPAKIDATVKATNDGLNRTFNATLEAQRPALSLVNGIIYIGFGGPFGDFGPTYYGWVVAVDSTDPTKIGAWSTRGGGGAIWSPGGFSSDGDGVLVTTGNAYGGTPATYMDSEGIIRLSGLALAKKDAYWPARWKLMDNTDQDMSSSSVLLLNVPGATPANYAITESKDAHLYFLDASKLGAATGGGEIIDQALTQSTPTLINHSARTSPVSYTTASGIHIALTVDRGPYVGCPASSTADGSLAVLMGFTVKPGAPVTLTQNWCTAIGGPSSQDQGTVRNRSASPLVTTTDGHSNPILWVAGSTSQTGTNVPANLLFGIDGETGAVLFQDKGGNCIGIRQWTTPIAVKGHIVIGGDNKLCSWSPGP
jgi:hypothetical protein